MTLVVSVTRLAQMADDAQGAGAVYPWGPPAGKTQTAVHCCRASPACFFVDSELEYMIHLLNFTHVLPDTKILASKH